MASKRVPEQSSCNDDIKLVEKFKEIVRSIGITETVSDVCIEDGLKGEGFASLSKLVTVTFENNHRKPLNLFVKVPTSNSSHTEMLQEMKAFEKEARFLVDYVSAAKEFCNRKGRDGFIDFYPKCYFGDETMIVLENLLDKGYELLYKGTPQDLEAATFAITTLAKHHAVGHAMIEEVGGVDNFFRRFPHLDYEAYDKPLFLQIWKESFDSSIKSHLKILESSVVPGGAEAASKLESYLGKPFKIVMDALTIEDNSFYVLCHGDYWNNNMMFLRDKERSKLVHHVAIDLQITRYSSPASDLGYYLFTSVQTKIRQNHLNELLKLYTDTLNEVSKDLGHPTCVTFEEILLDFRKRVGFGFWIGLTMAMGPGMTVYKDLDISAVDVKDWVEVCDKLMLTWIDENPDKTTEVAEELVAWINEYENLKLEDIY